MSCEATAARCAPPPSSLASRASRRRCAGERRTLLPLNSAIVVTDPLGDPLGRHRLGRLRAARRHRPRLHLCAAHRRRPDRVRRARGALPLRLPGRPAGHTQPRGRSEELGGHAARAVPGSWWCRWRTPGAGCWACPATGTRPCGSTAPPASAQPAATRPRGGDREPGRTDAAGSGAGRGDRAHLATVGRPSVRAGSRSRCGGWDRDWSMGSTGRRTAAEARRGMSESSALAHAADLIAGR